jgi:cardiolipin synthase
MRIVKLVGTVILIGILIAIIQYARTPSSNQGNPPQVTPEIGSTGSGVIGAFVEPDDGRKPVTDELTSARSSIDVMIYLLSDQTILKALADAESRGVQVRVILDKNPYGGYGNPEDVAKTLRDDGIDVRWASAKFTYTHAKTIIVDRSVALLLSLNLTKSSFDSNREFGVITSRTTDVASAQAIFDADWNGKAIDDPGDLIVSPLNSRLEMEALIRSATKTIDIYTEVMRDTEVVSLLEQRARSGIAVRLIMSPDNDPLAVQTLAVLRKAGVTIHLIGTPYIHAKAIVIDDSRVFVGSENFTATSLDKNREIGITSDDRGIVQRVESAFDHDFAKAHK